MDNQTKHLIGFAISAIIGATVLIYFANRSSQRFPGQDIPVTKEQVEISNVSRSIAEILPSVVGVPVGDIAVVPGNQGWRAVVFGVTDPSQKEKIIEATANFCKTTPSVGQIEVVFDIPPNQ